MYHLETHDIFTNLSHGFRLSFSTRSIIAWNHLTTPFTQTVLTALSRRDLNQAPIGHPNRCAPQPVAPVPDSWMLALYGTETLHHLSWTVSLAKSCYLTPLILQITSENSSLQAVLLVYLSSFRSSLKTYLFKLSYWYTSDPSGHLWKPISSSCPTDIPLIIQIISENSSLQAVLLIHLSSFRSSLKTHLSV